MKRPVSTTAALRFAALRVASDSERYLAMSRYIALRAGAAVVDTGLNGTRWNAAPVTAVFGKSRFLTSHEIKMLCNARWSHCSVCHSGLTASVDDIMVRSSETTKKFKRPTQVFRGCGGQVYASLQSLYTLNTAQEMCETWLRFDRTTTGFVSLGHPVLWTFKRFYVLNLQYIVRQKFKSR